MKLSFLLPVLGHELGLESTLASIPVNELSKKFDIEILIIWTPTKNYNNLKEMTKMAKNFNSKLVVEKKRGYGIAHREGYKLASGDIIISSDSDGTYPLESSNKFLEIFLKKRLDFLSINRFNDLESGSMTTTHFIGNKILTFLVNILLGLRIKDSQSGMWLIKKDIIKDLDFRENSATHATEVKIKPFKKFKSEETDGRYRTRKGKNKLGSFRLGISQVIYIFKYFLSRR